MLYGCQINSSLHPWAVGAPWKRSPSLPLHPYPSIPPLPTHCTIQTHWSWKLTGQLQEQLGFSQHFPKGDPFCFHPKARSFYELMWSSAWWEQKCLSTTERERVQQEGLGDVSCGHCCSAPISLPTLTPAQAQSCATHRCSVPWSPSCRWREANRFYLRPEGRREMD